MAKPKKEKNLILPQKPTGRPPVYSDTFVEQARVACSDLGATDIKLAKMFGVSKNCIYDWKRKHPDFKQAIQDGKDQYDLSTARECLLKRIKGYDYKETTMEPDKEGKLSIVKVVKKHIPADPTSTIFFLKNRDPRRWRDATSTDVTVKGAVEVSSPEISEKLKDIYSGVQKTGGADGP